MPFMVAFHDAGVLAEPSPELLDGGINALLSADPAATAALYPQVAASDILRWDQVADAYNRWVEEQYLPANALLSTFTPEGLHPLGFAAERITMELIGSCGAVFLERAVPEMGPDIDCFHTIQNHPIATPPAQTPTVRVVVPPLRYMHPATLDDFVAHPDYKRLFEETCTHMRAYLESVADAAPGVPLFVLGFVEPHMNPAGLFFHAREPLGHVLDRDPARGRAAAADPARHGAREGRDRGPRQHALARARLRRLDRAVGRAPAGHRRGAEDPEDQLPAQLEREEVQAAFPEIRVLGAEMNYVRRELLYSPFTQTEVRTAEDGVRSATVKKQAELQRHFEAGTSTGFLESLQLVCRVDEVTDPDSAAGQRALQLINKTNLAYADSGKNRGTAAFIERHAPGGGVLNLDAIRAPGHVQLGA
jgi:hypothetical protein